MIYQTIIESICARRNTSVRAQVLVLPRSDSSTEGLESSSLAVCVSGGIVLKLDRLRDRGVLRRSSGRHEVEHLLEASEDPEQLKQLCRRSLDLKEIRSNGLLLGQVTHRDVV